MSESKEKYYIEVEVDEGAKPSNEGLKVVDIVGSPYSQYEFCKSLIIPASELQRNEQPDAEVQEVIHWLYAHGEYEQLTSHGMNMCNKAIDLLKSLPKQEAREDEFGIGEEVEVSMNGEHWSRSTYREYQPFKHLTKDGLKWNYCRKIPQPTQSDLISSIKDLPEDKLSEALEAIEKVRGER